MRSKQLPSADTFLVRGGTARSAKTVTDKLASLGTVEQSSEGTIVKLTPGRAANPKSAWEALQSQAGDAEVDPLLLDETGEPHYPTGEITIRFKQTPTDAFLARFAEQHGLAVKARNEYVPSQVSFRVATHGYLPELLESLDPCEEVASAWANTKSRFRRS